MPYKATRRPCAHCGAVCYPASFGRCAACDRYHKAHGSERPDACIEAARRRKDARRVRASDDPMDAWPLDLRLARAKERARRYQRLDAFTGGH